MLMTARAKATVLRRLWLLISSFLISKYPAEGDNVKRCTKLKAFSWHPNCRELTYDQAKIMREEGIKVFPYNVDSPGEYQRMIQMDVDGVITSDPPLLSNLARA